MTCMKPLALGLGALLWCAPIFSQGWTEVAPLPDGFVSNHSYGFALNGKGYLVAGESTSGYTDSMYEYDPAADAWTALPDFPGAARGYTIGDQWNGQAWMGFGLSNSGYLNDLWMYDPATGEWTEKASCPCTARTHPAFIAEDGKVFVGLGGGPNGDMDDWWEYDMATDSWSQKPDFPASERHHPYQFGVDGMIYVGFGHNGPTIYNEMYRYDPSTEQWTEVATLPAEGRVAGTQFSYAGKGYALSGDGDDHSSMDEGEFWQYDPASDDWFQWPSHPGMSRWAPASFVLNDEVYLVNGMSYDPGTFDYMETNWKLAMQPAFANDVAVTAYLGETDICSGDETPITVQLTNMGSASFAAGSALGLTVVMEIDGEQVLSSDWSGELDTYQTAEFTLAPMRLNPIPNSRFGRLLRMKMWRMTRSPPKFRCLNPPPHNGSSPYSPTAGVGRPVGRSAIPSGSSWPSVCPVATIVKPFTRFPLNSPAPDASPSSSPTNTVMA